MFIECTTTDLTNAKIFLDTVVVMFYEYYTRTYTVKTVIVSYVDGPVGSFGGRSLTPPPPPMFT